METKNQERSLRGVLIDPIFWVGLFAAIYIAVLPMADTIALRNTALLGLLLCLAWQFPNIRSELRFGLPVLLWSAYLFIFPLIADDHAVAWSSLAGQWSRGLLAMLAGAGVAALLGRRMGAAVFYLGVASAVPVLVHLVLFVWKAWASGSIPWGYWGRETHHADLGYAAGHTAILMAASIVAGDRKFRPWAMAFILAALMLAVSVLAAFAAKDDSRWSNMATKISAGFLGNPIQIECEGTASVESDIVSRYGAGELSNSVINSIRDGDGARMVVLRAGMELAVKYPWGSDGSRQGFEKLLRRVCPSPAISMAHAHNGWIDTLLAIGWIGAFLYLWLLIYFCEQGVTNLRNERTLNEWGLVLIALSLFWIIRGLTDSVFRDHMLEMQGFVLTFALVALQGQNMQFKRS